MWIRNIGPVPFRNLLSRLVFAGQKEFVILSPSFSAKNRGLVKKQSCCQLLRRSFDYNSPAKCATNIPCHTEPNSPIRLLITFGTRHSAISKQFTSRPLIQLTPRKNQALRHVMISVALKKPFATPFSLPLSRGAGLFFALETGKQGRGREFQEIFCLSTY